MDLEFESLPGRPIIDVHVGKLGRSQMLLGSVDHISLDSYDRETDIVRVEPVFPPSDGLKSGTIWFTFEWDDVTPESEW